MSYINLLDILTNYYTILHGLPYANSIRVTMSYLNLLDVLTNYCTILYGLPSANSIRVTMSYINLLDISTNYYTILHYTTHETPITKMNKRASTCLLHSIVATKQHQITRKMTAHLLCTPVWRIYRGGRRHHAGVSVVILITLSCRPHVLPGHKDYMKYQYHRYRPQGQHRFCQCVYASPEG